MFRSLLAVWILSVFSGACSSASLRGGSANGNKAGSPDVTDSAAAPSPYPALQDCQASAPARLCGLASLTTELQTIDSLGSSRTLQGIRLTARKPDEQAWQDLTLKASCLSENSFVDAQWDRSVFEGSEMIITELSRTSWRQARFVDSDLRLSHFALAHFTGLTVQNSCLASINWSASHFEDVSMDNASAERSNFSGIISQGHFDFVRGRLGGSNFSGAVFEGPVNFQDTDLRGVDLSGVAFRSTVNWQGAQLSGATWMDGRICAEGSVGQCQ